MIEEFIVEEGDLGEVVLRLQPDIAEALGDFLHAADDSGWRKIGLELKVRGALTR